MTLVCLNSGTLTIEGEIAKLTANGEAGFGVIRNIGLGHVGVSRG